MVICFPDLLRAALVHVEPVIAVRVVITTNARIGSSVIVWCYGPVVYLQVFVRTVMASIAELFIIRLFV